MAEHVRNWQRLPPAARRQQWQRLADWVGWLQDNYQPWVKLPPCWPRHEALRSELNFFQQYYEEVLNGETGYEGTSWHAQLRAAAIEWEKLAGCRHDDSPWRTARPPDYDRSFEKHLAIAMDEQRENAGERKMRTSSPHGSTPSSRSSDRYP